MSLQQFSIRARAKSFQYAFEGIRDLFARDHNMVIHLVSTSLVVILAVVLMVNSTETILLAFAIGFVWMAEFFNTAIEKMMDIVSTQYHPKIKFVKDLSAAAVLVSAITAAVTGGIIFIPKIIVWLG